MISYCPLDEAPVAPPRLQPPSAPATTTPRKETAREETECNFVVLFFVAGVIILAVTDSVKK